MRGERSSGIKKSSCCLLKFFSDYCDLDEWESKLLLCGMEHWQTLYFISGFDESSTNKYFRGSSAAASVGHDRLENGAFLLSYGICVCVYVQYGDSSIWIWCFSSHVHVRTIYFTHTLMTSDLNLDTEVAWGKVVSWTGAEAHMATELDIGNYW